MRQLLARSLRALQRHRYSINDLGALKSAQHTSTGALTAGPLLQQQAWQVPGAATSWPTELTALRFFSTEDLRPVHASLTEGQYHKAADATLDHLYDVLEAFVEDLGLDDGDVEYSQGVLTVRLGEHGTYVINKQTPNRQIWLSSPVSGPFRYDSHEARWVYHRTGQDMLQQLQEELQQLVGSAPTL